MSVSRFMLLATTTACCVALTGCQGSSSSDASNTPTEPATATETVTATPDASSSEEPGVSEAPQADEGERTPPADRAHGPQVTRSGLTFDAATRACDAQAEAAGFTADWIDGLVSSNAGGEVFVIKARTASGAQDGRNLVLCKVRGTVDAPDVVAYKLIH